MFKGGPSDLGIKLLQKSDEDILENNYMFVILSNLSVISHLIFPQCFFLFLAQILKIT